MTTAEEIFFAIHRDNPREGPGSDASTRRAFALLPKLPPEARILDIGCGPGAQTMCLARLCEAEIHALDLYPQYLAQLSEQIEAEDLGGRILPKRGDMRHLDYPEEYFDVIWAEGSVYLMGFAEGLEAWRAYLKPDGAIAVSELTWLNEERPEEVSEFWTEHYPAMKSIAQNLAILEKKGYQPIGHFTLPESDWWVNYYTPLAAKLDHFFQRYAGDAAAREVIESERREMKLFETYADCYGYVFYVAGKR